MKGKHRDPHALIGERRIIQVRAGDFSPQCFGYTIDDRSMDGGSRPLARGTIAIVDPGREPKHENLVLIYEPDSDPVVRQYLRDGAATYTQTTGTTLPARALDSAHIIGVVRGSYTLFDD